VFSVAYSVAFYFSTRTFNCTSFRCETYEKWYFEYAGGEALGMGMIAYAFCIMNIIDRLKAIVNRLQSALRAQTIRVLPESAFRDRNRLESCF
jgi:hypothetical protein